MVRLLCIAVALASSVAFGDADDKPETRESFLQDQQNALQAELAEAPILPARTLGEVFKVEIVDGQMQFQLLAKDVLESAVIPLKEVQGICKVQRLNIPQSDHSFNISVHVIDKEKARAVGVEILSIATHTDFTIVVQSPGAAVTTEINASRANPVTGDETAARLYVQAENDDGTLDKPRAAIEAETPAQLIDENHDQLLESGSEGFRVVRAMHLLAGISERQVRQLLIADGAVDPRIDQQLKHAVALIDIDPEAGERELRDVLEHSGPSAAAALARGSRGGWTPDQIMRVDTILSPYLPDDPRAAETIKDSPARLIDLLYWPDARIREVVYRRLQAKAPAIGAFDPNKDPYTQFTTIEAMRSSFAVNP